MIDDKYIDFTPPTFMLEALRSEPVKFPLLIGEALDNSFDAGARKIAIEIDPDCISFWDDGHGIAEDKIKALIQSGGHAATNSTKLGRYGVGIKWQAIPAGDEFHVRSISVDGMVDWSLKWSTVLSSGKWQWLAPKYVAALPSAKPFTKISIRELRCKVPSKAALIRIADDIADRFHPALASGCEISLNGIAITAAPDPAVNDAIDVHLSFEGGKSARVRGGILVDSKSKRRLVHVGYEHRVIIPGRSFGCGDLSGPIFVRIELFGPWQLSKFKDELIPERSLDDLDAQVAELLRPMLEKSRSVAMSTRIDELSRKLTERLGADLAYVRPLKKREEIKPSEKRERKQHGISREGEDSSTGPARAPRPPKNKLQIHFDTCAAKYGFGYFDGDGRPKRIVLADDNPIVARLLEHRDDEHVVDILMTFAMFIYHHYQTEDELLFAEYGLRVWEMAVQRGSMLRAESA